MPALTPELLCLDLAATRAFYVNVLDFSVRYERPEEAFLRLTRDGVDLMFEQANGPGRRWITGPLERPFGRGVNFQIETLGVAALYESVVQSCASAIYLPLELKRYRCGDIVESCRQFIVQDPDGYLLRFAETLHVEPEPRRTTTAT